MGNPPINAAQRVLDIVQVLPMEKKEAAYGSPITDADIDRLIEAEGVGQWQPEVGKWSNETLIGRGHEFRTKSQVLSHSGGGIERTYQCNPLTDALFWALALGGYSDSTIQSGVYLHTMTMADLASVGLEPPSISMIEKVRSDESYLMPGVVPERIEIVFNRRDLPTMAVRLRSNGELRAVDGGYTYPTSPETLHFYKAVACDFQIGPVGGAFRSINEVVNQVTVALEITYADQAEMHPGGSQQDTSKGQISDTQLVKLRALTVTLELFKVENYWRDKILNNTPMMMKIMCVSDDVIVAPDVFFTRYQFNCLDIDSHTPAQVDDLQGETIVMTASVFDTATQASMLSVEVQNDVVEYLT